MIVTINEDTISVCINCDLSNNTNLCCGNSKIGYSTDGTYDDGVVNISPNDTIADAIDNINEYLNNLSVSGTNMVTVEASEDINEGDFVNIYDDNGVAKCRKAIAVSEDRRAHGFVINSVISGNNVNVYLEGLNNKLNGLVAGQVYFLSDTIAGGVSNVMPIPSSTQPIKIVQKLGVALSSDKLYFERSQIIVKRL